MATSAILGGIGAGANAISGIASSQQSKREGKRAAQQMQQQQDILNNFLMGEVDKDGNRSGGLMDTAMGGFQGAVGGLGDLAADNAASMQGLADQAAGINPQYDFNRFQFSGAPEVGGHEVGNFAADAMGTFGPLNLGGLNYGQSYDFRPGQDLMNQTMDAFRTEEAGVRANALDQMASQSAADMGGLDAALAGRGLGRGSGVATGALADLAGQQGQQMAGLERDLATLGAQTALQGAQFDVNRQLQEDQMQSGYNLGERQMKVQGQLGQQQLQTQHAIARGQTGASLAGQLENIAANYGLGVDDLRSRNWQADQQLRSNYDLGFQGMESQYGMDQATFALQNLMSQGDLRNTGFRSQLDTGLGVGGLYGDMLGPVLNSLMGSLGMQGEAVAAAGRGAGANDFGSSFMDLAKLLQKAGK